MESCKIKIYVSCHKESYIPVNQLLYPIQVGSALAPVKFKNLLYDDYGDNISDKNKRYCELTAQYWAWKNEEADYYGFFHYRRYLSFSLSKLKEDKWGNIIYQTISEKALQELALLEPKMERIIRTYDIILPKKRSLYKDENQKEQITVYEQYVTSDWHNERDLEIMLDVLAEKYPDYCEDADFYLGGTEAYECNMFIMKKEIFFRYSEWLFDILEEVEKRVSFHEYNIEETRVLGFLSERLLGIFCTHIKRIEKKRIFETQKALFLNVENTTCLAPAYEKKAIPIVMAANNQFVPYLCTFIQSIVDYSVNSRNYDLIVLNQDITEENIKKIRKILKTFNHISLRFFGVRRYMAGLNLFVDQHLSLETYYRLVIQEVLPDYHKILYLDCDMVVNTDLIELFNTDITNYLIAAVKDLDYIGSAKKYTKPSGYAKKVLKLNSSNDYFQAGVLLMNLDEFRKTYTVQDLLELAESYNWLHHDQDVLNYACRNRVKYIDQKWNVMINWREEASERMDIMKCAPAELYSNYLAARKKPCIIHYAGYQKPWNTKFCDYAEEFWHYARKTPYYEDILIESEKEVNKTPRMVSGKAGKVLKSDGIYAKIDGIEQEVYLDGIYIKFINKMNKKFPVGSRRRAFLRKLGKLFVR